VVLAASGSNNAFFSGQITVSGEALVVASGVTLYGNNSYSSELVSVSGTNSAIIGPGTIDGRGDLISGTPRLIQAKSITNFVVYDVRLKYRYRGDRASGQADVVLDAAAAVEKLLAEGERTDAISPGVPRTISSQRSRRALMGPVVQLDAKARENLEAARVLLPDDDAGRWEYHPNASASRAYYAAYQAVAHVAQGEQVAFTSDKNYYRHDSLPGDALAWHILDVDRKEDLEWLQGLRVKADYLADHVDLEEASQAAEVAEQLVAELLGPEART
jgi:hypothetical protein